MIRQVAEPGSGVHKPAGHREPVAGLAPSGSNLAPTSRPGAGTEWPLFVAQAYGSGDAGRATTAETAQDKEAVPTP